MLAVLNTAAADSLADDPAPKPGLLDFFNPFASIQPPSSRDASKAARTRLNQKTSGDTFFSAWTAWQQQYIQQQKAAFTSAILFAKPQPAWVETAYIDLYSSPYRDATAFYIAEQNERILLLHSETRWIKIQSSDGTLSWTDSAYLLDRVRFTSKDAQTSKPPSSSTISATPWEMYLGIGNFNHDVFNQMTLSHALSPYFALALSGADIINRVDDSFLIEASLRYYPSLALSFNPYFRLAAARLFHPDAWIPATELKDKASLIGVGLGLDYPLDPQVRLRLDASHYSSADSKTKGNGAFTSLPAYSLGLVYSPEQVAVLALEQAMQQKLAHRNSQLGLFAGAYRPKGSSAQPVTGLYLDYLLNESVFVEGAWANTHLDNRQLTTDDLSYYRLSLGHVFHRDDFLMVEQAGRSQNWLLWGFGNTRLAGQSHATAQLGMGWTLQMSELWSLRAQITDHMFKYAQSEDSKISHTPEATVGLALRF